MADLILKFGKHKNKTLQVIVDEDPKYVRWILAQYDCLNPEQRAYLEERTKENGFIMPFGKYKNKPLKQIASIDPNYMSWLSNNKYVIENCSQLHAEIGKLMA